MNHKDFIKLLIAQGRIREAISTFLQGARESGQVNIYNNLILTSARFNSNENDFNQNILTNENYRIEKAKINKSLNDYLTDYKPEANFIYKDSEFSTVDEMAKNQPSIIPEFFITEMKKQFEGEYKKMQRFEKLLSNMKDKEMRQEFVEELDLCDENISRIEKKYIQKIKNEKLDLSNSNIQQAVDDLKKLVSSRFDNVDNALNTLVFNTEEILNSINVDEIENNPEQKGNAEELLQAINERLNKLDLPVEREIGDNLNGEISTGAKLKVVIKLGILQYEQELVSLSAKEPIKSWKDLWRAIVKKSK